MSIILHALKYTVYVLCIHIRIMYIRTYVCTRMIRACVYVLNVQGDHINEVSFTSLLLICYLLFGGS